jgi:hypothetical protein
VAENQEWFKKIDFSERHCSPISPNPLAQSGFRFAPEAAAHWVGEAVKKKPSTVYIGTFAKWTFQSSIFLAIQSVTGLSLWRYNRLCTP